MRDAEEDMIKILTKYSKKIGDILIHCFTGSEEFAKKCIDLGCFFSLSGIITFKNANKLRDTIKILPIEKIIFETDSPYLTPDPYRGKTNEPSRVSLVAKKLAEIHSIPIEKITEITSNNATEIFQLSDL